jgi:hypothetical protein
LVADFGIAYVKRPLPEDLDELNTLDAREATTFIAGGDLYFRDLAAPGARERNVTFRETGGMGDVKDVEMSFDGTRLLFAMRMPEIEGADPEDQPKWNIWEYDIAADELRRIIASDIIAEDGHDVAPHYLPDGRIIFSSDRQRASKAILLDEGKPQFSALDESRNEHAVVLHVMNEDGSDIHQVSFNQSHDLDPVVLSSGEVVFTRWDNMGNRNNLNLYKMKPDGTELQLLYGANSHQTGTDGGLVEFLQPREMPDGSLMVVLRPGSGSYLGGDIVKIDVENYIENTQPTLANAGVLTGPAQESVSVNETRTDQLPSPGGRFNSAFPLWDGTDRAFVSWTPCRLLEGTRIVPCTDDRIADPNAEEAPPLYSIYIYDPEAGTQVPVFTPQEGFMYSDVVAAQPRTLPNIIFDKQGGVELDQTLVDENVGILDIRSVYDFEGAYSDFAAGIPTISALADPALTTADQRPARFLRIVKAVGIPDDNVKDFVGNAFGRSAGQLMREIVGYAPIEPDGSVRIKVPANVPLAVSALDQEGRRITARHQSWLQVRPGEVVECNGCHWPSSGVSHGRPDAFAAVNQGAPFDGYQFPNTEAMFFANFGETMAESRTRIDPTALNPTLDIRYDDVWTDEIAAGRPKDASFEYSYGDLTTPGPADAACQTTWTSTCRIVINYETHIHPLWGKDRGPDTCTDCHTTDNAGMDRVADAQLDLTDGPSDQAGRTDLFKSYVELLFPDFEEELNMAGNLTDVLVQRTDGAGNPVFLTDDEGNLILDDMGNPIPILDPVTVPPAMSVAGATVSGSFFDLFAPGGTHEGRLDPAELKLIAEWLDIGGQYYNNPFDAPDN